MFGGNSNWRGPVWFPMNLLILRALLQLHRYYGDGFKVECPTGSGRELHLGEVAAEIAARLTRTFTEDEHGRRPVFGGIEKFQTDPHWHDLLLVPRVLPRRQRRRHRREPPDRLDRDRRAADVHGARAAGPAGPDRGSGELTMRLPARPTIYEINTAVWLGGRHAGRRARRGRGTRSRRCRSTPSG